MRGYGVSVVFVRPSLYCIMQRLCEPSRQHGEYSIWEMTVRLRVIRDSRSNARTFVDLFDVPAGLQNPHKFLKMRYQMRPGPAEGQNSHRTRRATD